jgi:bifunctional non-homologous end joining protein LigD
MQQFPSIRLAVPMRVAAPFDDPAWIFELKMDGFRALAYIGEDGSCSLVSRKNNVYKSFANLCSALAELPVRNAVLDGEIASLDGKGRSQFYELLHRRGQPAFYAFDLLYMNGRDFRDLPLLERKKRLLRLIEKSKSPSIIYAQHVRGKGTALYREICKRDLEGIVAKRKDGLYSSTAQWLKVMNPAYTQHDGRHEMFNAFHDKTSRGRATR